MLDALSIAAGSWFLGLRGYDSRHIRPEDVRLRVVEAKSVVNWERQYPCVVETHGLVAEQHLVWKRTLQGDGGRTTYGEARTLKNLAQRLQREVREGTPVTLPLISYYGTGRLWQTPREHARVSGKPPSTKGQSRLTGYRNSVDPRLSVADLVQWVAKQAWLAFQQSGKESGPYRVMRRALVRNVHRAKEVLFDARLGEIVVHFDNGERQPFANLSDGQRCMLALVGDLAQKAATLNPHLDERALEQTPGVVLIDELDLHLHPTWQRHVIEGLRTTFPKLQFFCTTHSPFLIQSLRSGDELVMLDGQPTAHLGDQSIEQIATDIQGVPTTATSARYQEMKNVAHSYLLELAKTPRDRKNLDRKLRHMIAPYADNPAFQAFLELKRAAKRGA